MPPRWGRPPWGATRSERVRWERERAAAQAAWEEEQEYRYGRSQAAARGAARIEEVETEDSDDGHHGVLLAGHYKNGRGDTHEYGGTDLRRRFDTDRQRSDFDEYDDDGETLMLDEQDELGSEAVQLAFRDKEDELVKRALERIRRARMMGKKNVRLPPPEHEALQRKVENDRKTAEKEAKAKASKPGLAGKKSIERKAVAKSSSSNALVSAGKRKGSRTSLNQVELPPAVPLDYYDKPGSRPQSRARANTGSRGATPVGARRLASDQVYSRRPLPDDLDWVPRSRSNSALAYDPDMAYGFDPYGYPPRSNSRPSSSSRRNASGPAELGYPHIPSNPGRSANAALAQARAYGSDPAFMREQRVAAGAASRYYVGYSDEDEEDEDDDEGVQVDVRAYVSDVPSPEAGPSGRQVSPKKQPSGRTRRSAGKR